MKSKHIKLLDLINIFLKRNKKQENFICNTPYISCRDCDKSYKCLR
jgi:hypothetical protein